MSVLSGRPGPDHSSATWSTPGDVLEHRGAYYPPMKPEEVAVPVRSMSSRILLVLVGLATLAAAHFRLQHLSQYAGEKKIAYLVVVLLAALVGLWLIGSVFVRRPARGRGYRIAAVLEITILLCLVLAVDTPFYETMIRGGIIDFVTMRMGVAGADEFQSTEAARERTHFDVDPVPWYTGVSRRSSTWPVRSAVPCSCARQCTSGLYERRLYAVSSCAPNSGPIAVSHFSHRSIPH